MQAWLIFSSSKPAPQCVKRSFFPRQSPHPLKSRRLSIALSLLHISIPLYSKGHPFHAVFIEPYQARPRPSWRTPLIPHAPRCRKTGNSRSAGSSRKLKSSWNSCFLQMRKPLAQLVGKSLIKTSCLAKTGRGGLKPVGYGVKLTVMLEKVVLRTSLILTTFKNAMQRFSAYRRKYLLRWLREAHWQVRRSAISAEPASQRIELDSSHSPNRITYRAVNRLEVSVRWSDARGLPLSSCLREEASGDCNILGEGGNLKWFDN